MTHQPENLSGSQSTRGLLVTKVRLPPQEKFWEMGFLLHGRETQGVPDPQSYTDLGGTNCPWQAEGVPMSQPQSSGDPGT